MERVKIGFVGVGFMGQLAHLANYAVLGECEVVAISEPRRELARRVAERYGVERVFENHEELLEKSEVDAVVASQPYTRHSVLIPDVLERGKPVFTEKPLCLTVEEGRKLVRLAEENEALYMVGYHKRSDPAAEYAKALVEEWKESGEFGRMKYVRVTMPPGDWIGGGSDGLIQTGESPPSGESEAMPSYFDKETADLYNAFVNYYIHQVNMVRFMMGEPYRVTHADPSGVLLVAESESGVCGIIEMAPYGTTIDWEEKVLVGFERGYVEVELPPPLASQESGRVTVKREGNPPSRTEPSLPRVSAMRNQARNFVAAVRGEREAPCLAREALLDLELAREYVELHAPVRG